MVRHEAIGPNFGPRLRAAFGQKLQICGIIAILKKSGKAAIAALRDMMRNTRNNNPCDPCHDGEDTMRGDDYQERNEYTVLGFPGFSTGFPIWLIILICICFGSSVFIQKCKAQDDFHVIINNNDISDAVEKHKGGSFIHLLLQFQTRNHPNKQSIIEPIMLMWAGIDVKNFSSLTTSDKILLLHFFGDDDTSSLSNNLDQKLEKTKNYVYHRLTRELNNSFWDYANEIGEANINRHALIDLLTMMEKMYFCCHGISAEFMIEWMQSCQIDEKGRRILTLLHQHIKTEKSSDVSFRFFMQHALSNPNVIFGTNHNDELSGGSRASFIFGYDGDDVLCGGDGDSFIYGGAGNDILRGGKGVSHLDGETGNNTYLYSPEDGPLVITQDLYDLGYENILRMGPGIDGDSVKYTYDKQQNLLTIEILDTGTCITIINWVTTILGSPKPTIATIVFDDNSSHDYIEISKRIEFEIF